MNEEINKIIKKHLKEKGNKMPILQDIQELYGYLPINALEKVSEDLDISLEELYSIATFYSQFKLQKTGKYQISVCLGTVCYVKGSESILEELRRILNIKEGEVTSDGLFSLDTTRCLGCCSLAPVIMINDKVYKQVKKSEVKKIIDSYRGEK